MSSLEVDTGSQSPGQSAAGVQAPGTVAGGIGPGGIPTSLSVDQEGRLALASDDLFLAILTELRILNMFFAQVNGLVDDLNTLRNDPDNTTSAM